MPNSKLGESRGNRAKLYGGFETLESRIVLAANTATALATSTIQWNGLPTEVVKNQWVAEYAEEISANHAKSALTAEVMARVGDTNTSVRNLHSGRFGVITAPGLNEASVKAIAEADPAIVRIEPNVVLQLDEFVPNDPLFADQWDLRNDGSPRTLSHYRKYGLHDADNDATKVWGDLGVTGSHDVVIAVIDSGLDFSNPDFAGNIWENAAEIPGDGIDNDGNCLVDDFQGYNFLDQTSDASDEFGHGTSVAGVIGARGNNAIGTAGLNWNVGILPLRIADADGLISLDAAVDAIEYLVTLKERRDVGCGNQTGSPVNIVAANMSFSTPTYLGDLESAIERAGDSGILFSASAGNSGGDSDVPGKERFPASFDLESIISVAATDRGDFLAEFSNEGHASVDIAAPGKGLELITGNSGTSFSAPQVAGVAGLMAADPLSQTPLNLSDPGYNGPAAVAAMREAILGGAVPVSDLEGRIATGGRLNAYNSLQLMRHEFTTLDISLDDQVYATADYIDVRFSDSVDSATVTTGFSLQSSGSDGEVGTTDDVVLVPNSVSLVAGDTVKIDLSKDLSADTYRLTIAGTVASANGIDFNSGAGLVHDFVVEPASGIYEHNDSLSVATDTGLVNNGAVTYSDSSLIIGDGYFQGADVDIFSVDVTQGYSMISVDAIAGLSSLLDPTVRLFDASGAELAFIDDSSNSINSSLTALLAAGTYFVAVSGAGNVDYDPTVSGSGQLAFGVSSVEGEGLDSYRRYFLSIELTSVTAPAISGKLWHDYDKDGIMGSHEPGLADWTVFVDSNENGVLDTGETATATNSTGQYVFEGLAAAKSGTSYKVVVETPGGWENTTVMSQPAVLFPDSWTEHVSFGARIDSSSLTVSSNSDFVRPSGTFGPHTDITIREAIDLALNYDDVNEVTLSSQLTGAIVLTKGQLLVEDSDLAIVGPGDDVLAIQSMESWPGVHARARDRILEVTASAALSISGIEISGGNAPRLQERRDFEQASGGAILSAGQLTLDNVTVRENTALENGGGIFNTPSGTLSVSQSNIEDNSSLSIIGDRDAYLNSLERVQYGGGGGLHNLGNATFSDSYFANNVAIEGEGGAILSDGNSNTHIQRSIIIGNTAQRDGGGFRLLSGASTIDTTTFSANSTEGGDRFGTGNVLGSGGAISVNRRDGVSSDVDLSILNSTLAENVAATEGGGIQLQGSGQTSLFNTIIADNFRLDDGLLIADDTNTQSGTMFSGNGNAVGAYRGDRPGGKVGSPSSPLEVHLTPFGDVGGEIPAYGLLPASPAIDIGDNTAATSAGLTTDKRGVTRILDGNRDGIDTVDAGAVEYVWGDMDGNGVLDATDIDLLYANFGNELYDITGEGVTDTFDVDVLVRQALNTEYGDANVDGYVDFADRLIWYYNRFQTGGWAQGDFNGDGQVDGLDYLILTGQPPSNFVNFAITSYSVGEGNGVVTIEVARTGDTSGSTSVDFATKSGTATSNVDFESTSGTLTFQPGETTATIDVAIIDDNDFDGGIPIQEGDEIFEVILSNSDGGALQMPHIATVTIINDDAGPQILEVTPVAMLVRTAWDLSAGRQAWDSRSMPMANDATEFVTAQDCFDPELSSRLIVNLGCTDELIDRRSGHMVSMDSVSVLPESGRIQESRLKQELSEFWFDRAARCE